MPKIPRGSPKVSYKRRPGDPRQGYNRRNHMYFTIVFEVSSLYAQLARRGALEALGVDFRRQEGAPKGLKWSRNAARKRPENDLKTELVLDAVWKPSWSSKRGWDAAGRRNGGGLRGGIKGWGLKHCKEFS